MQEVVQHLALLPLAKVKLELEIEVDVPGGVAEATVRTVSENAAVLKFSGSNFE
ncbi:MAG: hypothetical protein FJ100_22710 [Deltaproteobacteria bacterium]|nr:hypothetical protein [Deltaproteobacteria bacterium]MBM4346196.1 hypothetical protein [Deltaproteobacteria bacterium]